MRFLTNDLCIVLLLFPAVTALIICIISTLRHTKEELYYPLFLRWVEMFVLMYIAFMPGIISTIVCAHDASVAMVAEQYDLPKKDAKVFFCARESINNDDVSPISNTICFSRADGKMYRYEDNRGHMRIMGPVLNEAKEQKVYEYFDTFVTYMEHEQVVPKREIATFCIVSAIYGLIMISIVPEIVDRFMRKKKRGSHMYVLSGKLDLPHK